MPNLEDLAEEAKMFKLASELIPALSAEREPQFVRIFDMAGWNAAKMRGALAAGYLMLPDYKRLRFENDIAKDPENLPMSAHQAVPLFLPAQSDLEINAINRALGLSPPFARSVSVHTDRTQSRVS